MPSTKALPPIPFAALLQRLNTKQLHYDKARAREVQDRLWPDDVRKISPHDMTGCVENHGIECSHPQFLGVHFPHLALLFKDIRKKLGIGGGVSCMPLNYHWLNEEMKEIKSKELEDPFLISDVLTIDILHLKIFNNLLKDL